MDKTRQAEHKCVSKQYNHKSDVLTLAQRANRDIVNILKSYGETTATSSIKPLQRKLVKWCKKRNITGMSAIKVQDVLRIKFPTLTFVREQIDGNVVTEENDGVTAVGKLKSELTMIAIELRKEIMQTEDESVYNDAIIDARLLKFDKTVLPSVPFDDIDVFLQFEVIIRASDILCGGLVTEFLAIENVKSGNFVKACWRQVITDELAEKFTWNGSSDQINLRDMAITAAIKNAFKQKYKLN